MTERLTPQQRERLAAQNARDREPSIWQRLIPLLCLAIALGGGFCLGVRFGESRVIAQRDAAIKELAVLRATYQWTKETLSK